MEHINDFDGYYARILDWFRDSVYAHETITAAKEGIRANICEMLEIEEENETSKSALKAFFDALDTAQKKLNPDCYAQRICKLAQQTHEECGDYELEYCECDRSCNECSLAAEAFMVV